MPEYNVHEQVTYIVEGDNPADAMARFLADPNKYFSAVPERYMSDENGEDVDPESEEA